MRLGMGSLRGWVYVIGYARADLRVSARPATIGADAILPSVRNRCGVVPPRRLHEH